MTASSSRGPADRTPPPRSGHGGPHAPPPRDRLRADLGASLVVFLVAVPLSLGIALASGAPLMSGLIAAVVGGVVVGLLGGTPLQVSGPAAGLTVVVAELITRFGWQTTCLITAGAGLLQIVFGLTRVARFAQAIPPAVVHGMLAGIGVSIALAQAHVVLGGDPPPGAVASLFALPQQVASAHLGALAVGALTAAVLLGWPRLPGRAGTVPAPLVAVVAATGLALSWPDVPRIALPANLLEAITLPSLLPAGPWSGIVIGVLTVAAVASIESLLSAVAVDRLQDGPRARPDRELVGQGTANTVSGLVGGLPVTGVIVRSSTNVRSGARTSAATVLHGIWVAVFGVALVGVLERVPLAALAALLVVVGLQLVRPAELRAARNHGELAVLLGTVAGVLTLGLLQGVAIGLALAGLQTLHRAVRARVRVKGPDADGRRHVVVEGALSFLSVPALSRALAAVPAGVPVRVDLVVDYLDHAAFDHLDGWLRRRRHGGAEVEVREPAAAAEQHGPLPLRTAQPHSPHGLLLTCADSSVQPRVITRSGPGDLITVQNVGNLVAGTAVRAALQYATAVLDVPLIAVCGHGGCGAMRGLLDGGASGALGDWLEAGSAGLTALQAGHPVGRAARADGYDEADALAMVNVAMQLHALRAEHPDRTVRGLFFDVRTARVLVLDEAAARFRPAA